ncbi:type I-C CRISPR-associated protein Cas8c/Csd1 [Caldalkalibacillus thermarum]|uniref:type I-C CRISPR-associated protein Cas8c/Csd1 n=1 Tax=Caldalkalibacillus thermarum TaxID=296745 RepID=UPI00166779A3|nr:type I-C CRISPR-associated protein Cas8c/Csd1 [Caldalkalibacillus thermarum]GGK34692.1 type I-C CRISPR-associated protein Cas8c/Csd1 [Caldalkalibacillus thermarum]
MLYELIELATKLQKAKKLPPASYKPKSVTWVIDLSGVKPHLKGPFKKGEYRIVEAPDRKRSGRVSKDNLKPYLLLDDARYVLGVPENEMKVDEAKLMHQGFVQLLQEAYAKTGIEELAKILEFLNQPLPEEFRQKIKAKETITFKIDQELFPFERPEIQRFWSEYLAENLLSNDKAECSICGKKKPYVRYLPNPVMVFGQSCQLTSFNSPSFESMGKSQTNNVPVCFSCATLTVDTLNYLLRDSQHHTVVLFNERDILRSQIAVYWLKQPAEMSWKGITLDQKLFAAPIQNLVFDEEEKRRVPPPELEQLQELVKLPKTGREQALRIDEASFHMAVLSANKGRLVVREWIHTSVSRLLTNLGQYLDAIRIVHPQGEQDKVQPLPVILQAIEVSDVNLVRQILRTIYQGYTPPNQLLVAALNRFRLPQVLTDPTETWKYHALASVLKLALTYGKEESKTMESLNLGYLEPSYLCGRLLAVLEEIQQRASGYKVGTTVVQRFYGAASTAPASTFGPLLRLTTTAHLPKVSPEMGRLLEEVIKQLDKAGGFPTTLTLKQQAEFGLGFYHQRAAFRSQRKK